MLPKWKRWLCAWGPAIGLYTIISFLSDQSKLPGPAGAEVEFLWFKTAHLIIYGVLGLLVYRGVRMTFPKAAWLLQKHIVLTLIVLFFLAGADELHQYFIPGRGAHWRDVGIDLLGASAAVLWWVSRYNRSIPGDYFYRYCQE